MSASSGATLRTLLALDREIRRESGRRRRGAQVILAVAVTFFLIGQLFLIRAVPYGTQRGTVAAFASSLIVLGYCVAPLVLGRAGFGLRADHVRHLPVGATLLRHALLLGWLRSPAALGLAAGLVGGTLSASTDVVRGTVGVVAALVLVVLALVLGRVVELTVAATARSLVGRLVTAVLTIVLGAAAYVAFLFVGRLVLAVGDSPLLGAVARTLPPGWPVLITEASTAWWLVAATLLGLVLLTVGAIALWQRGIQRVLQGYVTPTPSGTARSGSSSRAPRSALQVAVGAELLLVRDPRRLALLVLPIMFAALGVLVMLDGPDIYLLQWGAPVVMAICTTPFTNAYGLDGPSSWRVIATPGARSLLVTARMVVAGGSALIIGTLSTIAGRAIRGTPWESLPVAVAVLLACGAGVAAMVGLMAARAPYKVEEGSVMSALTARGSMSGAAVGWSLITVLGVALVAVPGALLALLLPSPWGWAGVPVAAVVGWFVLRWGKRLSLASLIERGPEIYAVVR